MSRHCLRIWSWIWVAALGAALPAGATIESADLNVIRTVTEGDWLRLRLETLGLNLSYPAYRIRIELTPEAVEFTLSASSGMAQHLEEAGRGET